MWVDGSAGLPYTTQEKNIFTAAVRFLDHKSNTWTEFVLLSMHKYRRCYATDAECIAVHEAFRLASRLTDEFDLLVILSDCQTVVRGIRDRTLPRHLCDTSWATSLFWYANMLNDLGIVVELRWVPGHSKVEGNEQVDVLARQSRVCAQMWLGQNVQDLMLQNVTIMARSRQSILLAIRRKIDWRAGNEKDYEELCYEEITTT